MVTNQRMVQLWRQDTSLRQRISSSFLPLLFLLLLLFVLLLLEDSGVPGGVGLLSAHQGPLVRQTTQPAQQLPVTFPLVL